MESFSTGRGTVVLDLREVLPPQGETAVAVNAEGETLSLVIRYDVADAGSGEEVRVVNFSGVCSYIVATFPGANLFRIGEVDVSALGNLVEYQRSDAAREWQARLEHRRRPIRHYQVVFLTENRRIDVFAESCSW